MTDINWIGEIPQDWKLKRSKSLIISRDGGAWGEDEHNDETDTICIRIADFDYDKLTLKANNDYTKRNYNKSTISKLLLKKGDILVEKSGGGEKTPVGRTIMFDEDFEALFANFMDRLRVDENQVLPMFMEYLFVAMYQNDISRLYIKQTTGIQNLNLTELLDREYFPVPHMDEQAKIVDFLNCKCKNIDEILFDLNNQVEKLIKYRNSLIYNVTSKGIKKHLTYKEVDNEWYPEIPEHWRFMAMKRLTSILTCGVASTPEYVDEEDGVLFLSAQNIQNNKLDLSIKKYIPVSLHKALTKNRKPEKGDILQVRVGATIGKSAIVDIDEEFSVYVSLSHIRTNENMNNKFMNYIIGTDMFKEMASIDVDYAGSQGNLNVADLKEIKIPVPPIDEQIEIVNFLDDKCAKIDELIKDKQTQIEKMEKYKKSLIYEYVTGKKRVKGV